MEDFLRRYPGARRAPRGCEPTEFLDRSELRPLPDSLSDVLEHANERPPPLTIARRCRMIRLEALRTAPRPGGGRGMFRFLNSDGRSRGSAEAVHGDFGRVVHTEGHGRGACQAGRGTRRQGRPCQGDREARRSHHDRRSRSQGPVCSCEVSRGRCQEAHREGAVPGDPLYVQADVEGLRLSPAGSTNIYPDLTEEEKELAREVFYEEARVRAKEMEEGMLHALRKAVGGRIPGLRPHPQRPGLEEDARQPRIQGGIREDRGRIQAP